MVANMVDQNFLGASFWGWAGIATAKGMNSTSNTLCAGSNPFLHFREEEDQFEAYIQAVLCLTSLFILS